MTQMFENHSFIYTVKKNKGNLYGVSSGSIRFGYVPNREEGRDFRVENKIVELDKALKLIGCPLHAVQKVASEAIRMADGFTLVSGSGPRDYGNKVPVPHLIDNLRVHPQTIQTLEMCSVYVIVNGKPYNRGQKLRLPPIKPMEGEEEPRVIRVPETLTDPESEEEVSTTDEGSLPQGTLILFTSKVNMRYAKKKLRHNITYKAISGHIGFSSVTSFDVRSSYTSHIYGECELLSLEPYKQNDRADLAKCPLTRAVKQFISNEIQSYAEKFEAQDRRRYDNREKNAISKMNEFLDNWKNRFLEDMLHGMWGGDGDGPPPPPPPLPSGKPDRLELSLTHHRAGVGISLRPRLKFFDVEGQRIRKVPFRWVSEDNNVAMVIEDLNMINTFHYGKTNIYAETLDGGVTSNMVPLEVVKIHKISIFPSEIDVASGRRQKLEAVCTLDNDEDVKNVLLEWIVDDRKIAGVSSSGTVFGFSPGETNVVAGDDKCVSEEPAVVKVVPGEGRGKGDEEGKGYPTVLVSGMIDRDPTTSEYRFFSKEEPPVIQEPYDVKRNIWWINSNSPLAELYLNVNKGYGYHTQAWRMYHLERYIDVIVQILLTKSPDETEEISIDDWIMLWGMRVTQIQHAATADLSEFIGTGLSE